MSKIPDDPTFGDAPEIEESTATLDPSENGDRGAIEFFGKALNMFESGVQEMIFDYQIGDKKGKLKIELSEVAE